MPNPITSSSLVERASASQSAAVPRGAIVVIVGPAESGPTEPRRVDNPDDAYTFYGDGPLAQAVQLAHLGVKIGAGTTGSTLLPNVFALRASTGSQGQLVLQDEAGFDAITLRSLERSKRANEFRVGENRFGYRFTSPFLTEPVTISVDKTGQSLTDRTAKSPTQFADAIRAAFPNDLIAEVHYRPARYEIKINSLAADVTVVNDSGTAVVDFTAATNVQMDARQVQTPAGDSYTFVDRDPQSDFLTTGAGLHNAILAPDNVDARVYALTAGKIVEVPKDSDTARIDRLVDAKRVGFGATGSLLNIRTTGVGATAAVPLASAGQNAGVKVSEGYFRVRRHTAGTFVTSNITGFDFDGVGTVPVANGVRFSFSAKQGIAGDTVGFANIAAPYNATTALAYETRLGDHYVYEHPDSRYLGLAQKHFRLELQPLGSDDLVSVPLKFENYGVDDGTTVRAHLTVDAMDIAQLTLNGADFAARYGSAFDDARVYVSYDTSVFALEEKATATALDPSSAVIQFFVTKDQITFNAPLPHALAVRGLRVTQYRLGRDVIAERTEAGGNRFRFSGTSNQPGEAGAPVGKMEVILGFQYDAEPGWPVIDSRTTGDPFTGGSSGLNSDAGLIAQAIGQALTDYRTDDVIGRARFIVPAGVHLDDVVKDYDAVTGTPVERACDILGVLDRHRARVDSEGASGIFYLSVKPMKPNSATGRFTDAQKIQRFSELVQVDPSDPARAANVLGSGSYPLFGFFDAPATVVLGSRQFESSMTPYFAGIRSVLPNDTALYQLTLPAYIRPHYKYDVPVTGGDTMTGILATTGRINAWSARRNEIRLADERSGAGFLSDASGNLVPSDLQSGYAVLAVNEFRQRVVQRLDALRGPIRSSIAVLRTRIETSIDDEVKRTVGIDGLVGFNAEQSIIVFNDGGRAIGITVNLTVRTMGELRRISINVGSTGPDLAVSAGPSNIPVAG